MARIYEELKIDCLPIAINSGYVWPKKIILKILIKKLQFLFLNRYPQDLNKDEFLKTLEKEIYSELRYVKLTFHWH